MFSDDNASESNPKSTHTLSTDSEPAEKTNCDTTNGLPAEGGTKAGAGGGGGAGKGGLSDMPWQTLVSYVDELTVGGRRNSKGQFVDAMGTFPGFGKKKPPKVAPDCFPAKFYER